MTVRYWAGAGRAAGTDSDTRQAATVGDLLDQLRSGPGMADLIAACSVLVDGQAAAASTELTDGAVVDLLPPFAGG